MQDDFLRAPGVSNLNLRPNRIKESIINFHSKVALACKEGLDKKASVRATIEGSVYILMHDEAGMKDQLNSSLAIVESVDSAKVVLFSKEQADVFMSIDLPDYVPELPFSSMLFTFGSLIQQEYSPQFSGDFDRGSLACVTIREVRCLEEECGSGWGIVYTKGEATIYQACFLYGDGGVEFLNFQSNNPADSLTMAANASARRREATDRWKKLVLACVGYMNCKNVRLEKISPTKKSTRKRERKGKSSLAPYYRCYVHRDTQGDTSPDGSGTSHAFRYDVRGHFRQLQDGRIIWVTPHQRGLSHDLYVPKTYVVK